MYRIRLRWPSPALAVAVVALLVALGATALAATKINGTTIKVASEPGNRLVKNSVTGMQVKESDLGSVPRAIKAKTATNATFADTAQAAYKAGGLYGLQIADSGSIDNPPNVGTAGSAFCPNGEHAIGGYIDDTTNARQALNDEHLTNDHTGWVGSVYNNASIDESFSVHAICANATYAP